jgi:hypothetical protein
MNTYVYDYFPCVPFLEIAASTKRSGKTTLLNCLKMLTRQAEQFAIVRILTVLRMIESFEGRITVLIDEAEQFSKPSLGELRSGVATGYLRGAQHAVSVGTKFQRFRTFAPWAFAQIGNVHDVLRDRCIEIELERGKPLAILAEEEFQAMAQAQELKAELLQYAATKTKDGKLHIPVVAPDWLSGRERQLWMPLVSLASWLGVHADTMRMLERASVDFGLLKTLPPKTWHSAQDEKDTEERDMAERLVVDALTVYRQGETWVPTTELVERLRAVPTMPWRAWRGAGLNEHLFGALVARYGINSVTKDLPGSTKKNRKQAHGYLLKPLQDIKH